MTPPGRGFDSSLGFLTGGEDHWTSQIHLPCGRAVDLTYGWSSNRTLTAASALNGTYTGTSFSDRATQLIRDHDVQKPLFLYAALHNTHAPIESPPEYAGMYQYNQTKRNLYYGQVSFVDATVANMTEALHAKDMWANTLFIW
jgi:arylsulfatase B